MAHKHNHRPLIASATMLGIGLGGFVDGILFHQLLQVHNMLSARFPTFGVEAQSLVVNLEINMFWDGLFHTFCFLMTTVGITMLWSAVQRRDVPLATGTFVGSLFLGWGIFNLVEGVINHHLLHIHHVVETDNHLVWDLGFLASGALFIAIGLVCIRGGISITVTRPPESMGMAK